MFMVTLAHVQPTGKLCPKKNLPVLGSFFVDARLPAPDFFLLESKYKIQVRKYPDLGPQIPGFQVQTLKNTQVVPLAQRQLTRSAASLQVRCFQVIRKTTRTALWAPLIGQEG